MALAGRDWFIPERLTSSLSLGSIGDGQKMDSAVPAVLGRADELVWSSPAGNGQIPRISWTAGDPAGQQSSSDALFLAALLFSVPVAGVVLALERLIDR